MSAVLNGSEFLLVFLMHIRGSENCLLRKTFVLNTILANPKRIVVTTISTVVRFRFDRDSDDPSHKSFVLTVNLHATVYPMGYNCIEAFVLTAQEVFWYDPDCLHMCVSTGYFN